MMADISDDQDTDASLELNSLDSDENIRNFMFASDGQMADQSLHYQYNLYTVCALAVKCQHNQMPISSLHSVNKSAGLWLPYIAVKECFKYSKMGALLTEFFCKELNLPCDRSKLLEGEMPLLFEKIMLHSITRIQIPDGEFITRNIYIARWRSSDKNCCKNTAHIRWIPVGLVCDSQQGNGESSNGNSQQQQPAESPSTSSSNNNSGAAATAATATAATNNTNANNNNNSSTPAPPGAGPSNDPNKSSNYQSLINRFWGSEVATYAAHLKTMKVSAMGQLMQVTEQTGNEVFKYVFRGNTANPQTGTGNTPTTTLAATPTATGNSGTTTTTTTTTNGAGTTTAAGATPAQPATPNRVVNTNNKTRDLFSQFLSDANFAENDVLKIYSDFVQHCYPSINMSLTSFQDYCQKINISAFYDDKTLKNIFKAMNYKVKNYIAFNEFLLGLAALDPSSPHSQPRYTYIFRFYDFDSDGFLDRDDIKRMLAEIRHLKPPLATGTDTNKGTSDVSESINRLINENHKINYESFLNEINSGNLDGTVNLCRCPKPIMWLINEASAYELILSKHNRPFGPKIAATCPKCRPKNYSMAVHTVKLNKSGRIEDPKSLAYLEKKDFDFCDQKLKNILRKHSIEYIFKPTSNSNYVLNLIRKLAGYCRMNDDRKKEVRNQVLNGLSVNIIRTLCDEVTEIFTTETRVVKVNTPCFVLGDIHGNINDLLIFEEQLWPMAPSVNAPNVLFLGDYVDRGEFSIEVVCYLFAMKTLAPTKFFLLRGNHEVRPIQRSFTFEKECLDKYGNNGPCIFETFNRVFDALPFSGVIDESIYCAHGGIPFTQTKIEDLMKAPAIIQDPEQEAPAVWEILWSDPITNNEFHELTEFMKKKDDCGYMSNMKRSTAFYFAETATANFLKKNNLTHVIRAHEVINDGYKFNHRGMVITVFSSSHYCGGPNKAAAIMIEGFESDGFIKIISLDT